MAKKIDGSVDENLKDIVKDKNGDNFSMSFIKDTTTSQLREV